MTRNHIWHQCNSELWLKNNNNNETVLNFLWQFFFSFLIFFKNPKQLEQAPYAGVGDDSDDNYEDCDRGGDDFDDSDGGEDDYDDCDQGGDDFDDDDGAVAAWEWQGWIGSFNRPWQTSQKRPIFAVRFNFVSNQL